MLAKYNVEMIGATADAIDKAEDRPLLTKPCVPLVWLARVPVLPTRMEEAYGVSGNQVGFPCIIRPSFTMGGSGGGIAYNREEFEEICTRRSGSVTNQRVAD